ncbi:MAG: hypothetical protein ACM3OO_12135 [Planctomycetaceae bacterium]
MNDTFSFVAPVMPRREVDPFVRTVVVFLALFLAFVIAFGSFVAWHQRLADARAAAAEARMQAQAQARADALVAGFLDPNGAVDAAVRGELGRGASRALDTYVHTASFAKAGPSELAAPDVVFTDGPSRAPSVVSVDVAAGSWAAAALGPSGTCYWIRTTADGETYYGSGSTCTGTAAQAAWSPSW